MIVRVENSPRVNKRYRVFLNTNKYFDFGYSDGKTYIDHGDKALKSAYIRRHLGNPIEKRLIANLVPSPALFSYALLWGPTVDLKENIAILNKAFREKVSK